MENVQKSDQCQRPGCECARPASEDYCGEHCRNAQKGGMDNDCGCGHPECAG